MLNWSLLDLKGALTLLRADPVSFSPEALETMASLCEPKADTWENAFRWVLRAWPLQKDKLPYDPRWIQVDNHYPTGSIICGTEEECALLRAILHTAAQLRRDEKLSELSNLADAAHNFPAMIAERDRHAPAICPEGAAAHPPEQWRDAAAASAVGRTGYLGKDQALCRVIQHNRG